MLLPRLLLFVLVVCSAIPRTAAALETIEGTIRAAVSGLPLASIDLDVFDDSGTAVNIGTARSDVLGRYLVVLPGPGTYTIRADPSAAQGVATQFHSGVFLKSAATPIAVAFGQSIRNIDFFLSAGTLLHGVVSGGGLPLADVDMDVYAANGEFLSSYPARTGLGGSYQVGALPPGQYFVRADPDVALGQYFVDAFFGGSPTLVGASPVTVGATPLAGVDIALSPGGSVLGVVTDAASGLPIAGLDLDLFDAAGNRMPVNATTDAAGQYEIGAMAPGSYILRVDPTLAQGFARTYFRTAPILADATLISVVAGGPVPGFDFSLPPGRAIRGVVRDAAMATPLVGIDLDVFDALGRRTRFSARTDGTGAFVLGPLAAGTYFVRADPDVRLGQYFVTAFFGGAPRLAGAAPVVVGATDAVGVDIDLASGGSLAGVVTDAATAAPLAGLDIDVFDALGNRVSVDATTDAVGHYEIGAMLPGGYRLRVDPALGEGHARTYFPAAAHLDDSQVLGVAAGGPTPNVNVAVGPGGTIDGMVRDAATVGALVAVDLDVFDAAGRLTRFDARTDAAGGYAIGALQPGSYFVRADPDPLTGLAEQVFAGKIDVAFGTPVAVLAGQTTSAVDFALPAGGSIAGTAHDATGLALAGIDLDLYEAASGTRLRKTALTLVDGTYRLGSLNPGSYKLRVDPAAALGLARVYFDAQPNLDLADPLVVGPGAVTSPVDFLIPPGGLVTGTVEDTVGTPVSGSIVEALSMAGTQLGPSATVDPTGAYRLVDLPVGNVLVRARPGPGQIFAPTFFGGATVPALAVPVTVLGGQTTTGVRIAVPEPLPGLGILVASLALLSRRRRWSGV